MRTYSIEKRFGVSGDHNMFLNTKPEENKKFDFFEFLISEEGGVVAEPAWFSGLLRRNKYQDGSYEGYSKKILTDTKSAPDIHGTCYAILAMKSVGRTPPKGAVDYIEKLKTRDGSFALYPRNESRDDVKKAKWHGELAQLIEAADRPHGNMETTHWATLALKAAGRNVPEESVRYVKSLRNEDGSYGWDRDDSDLGQQLSKRAPHASRDVLDGTLERTREALTVLKVAGAELSPKEWQETVDYILSRLEDESTDRRVTGGPSYIGTCYDAIVSLNILGHELSPEEKKDVMKQLEKPIGFSSDPVWEDEFKTRAIKMCLGLFPVREELQPDSTQSVIPNCVKRAYYAVLLAKLEAYE